MDDSLKILLQAQLDTKTSLSTINGQIRQLSKGLEKLNVKINFDDNVLRDLNSQIKEITKDLTKSNDVSVKINTSKLEKTKSIFKDIEGELISLKEKVSFDKEGNQITKLVSQFKLLDGTIKTITQGSSGRIINEQSEKNLQKIQNDREKALQQEQKIRENITKQEQQSLAQMQKQYQTTLDLFNTLKNDSKNLFKVSGDRNDLEKYINQLASIKVQLSDMQKGKLSITDSKTTQEIQKQLSLMEQEFNRQKSVIDLARQKEQILTQINTKLKEIQGLRSNTADSGEIERLNKIEQSLKGVKTNATDANSQLKLINAEIKNFKIDAKQSEAFKKLAFDIEQFQKNTKSKLQNLFDLGRIDSSQLNKFLGQVNSLSTSTPNARQEMIALRNEITNVARNANTGATGIQKFAKNVLQLAGISSVYTVMQSLVGITKELTSNVMELDSAMISLQRVSSGTTSTYEEFKNNMFQVADSVGSTATNMINSAKEFSQLGYSLEESGKLAETASKLATAGEMSIDEATKNLTASLTAFNMEVADSEKIADIYNKMGNVMSVTSSDVGQALQRSANALAQANNSLEESVALIATANRSIQNSERVGTALKTISMRIRGVSEDGEVLNEKLGEIVEKYTGVKIFDEATQEFKSTYQIVLELSKVWSTLSDKQQALLAEKLSGKQNAEVFLAMLNNSKDLVKGLEEAQNALGTTEEEMAIVMTSYEAKVNQLKNAWLELGQTLINSEFVKGLIDGLTNLVQGITTLVDNLDRVKPVLGTILVLITSIKAQNILASITSSVSGIKTLGTSLGSLVGLLGNATTGAMSFSSVLSALNLNPVVLGITALAGSLLYFKNKADEARIAEEQLDQQRTQKLNTLKEEVSSTENVRKSYDEINESTMTRAEKARELTKLQLDLINTYGAEANGIDLINGNYNQNIAILDELIRKKKEYLAQELGDKNEDLSLDAMNARTMGGDFSKGEIYHVDDTQAEELDLITEQLNEMYDNAKISSTALDDLFGKKRTISFVGDINESLEMMKVMKEMMKGTSLEGTDLYDALTDGISKMSDIAMEYNSNELERLKIQSDLIASEAMRQAGIEDLNDATDEQISKCSNYIDTLSDVDKKAKDLASSLLGISTASDADGIETITAKLNGLKKSSEECEQAVGKIETAMADLTGILEDLDAGNGITSGSLKKIISNYPDLLQYMNDEGELREQLQKKMEDYSDQYKNSSR